MTNLTQTLRIGASVALLCAIALCARGNTNLTTLVSFDGSNGGQPWAGLVLGKDGNFYGTTDQYGYYSGGTVFRMTPDGEVTNLHSFTRGSGGAYPKAGLVQGEDGNFYGTATHGGESATESYAGDGIVFRITPGGDFTSLASFHGTNGSMPWAASMIVGSDGFLYGTTAAGGLTNSFNPPGFGTVFRITTNGLLTSLYSLSYDLGDASYGGLVEGADGNFYGATHSGGPNSGGTVFKITPDGNHTTLVAFSYQGTNGKGPFSSLLRGKDGNFYGTTSEGGASYGDPQSVNAGGYGTIFKMTPDGKLTRLFSFARTNGSYPYATLVEDEKGNFYGTTVSGGANTNELFPGVIGYAGYGTVFRFASNGVLTTLVSFGYTNGAQPFANLAWGADGKLYGTTVRGGAYDLGTVFRLSVDASRPKIRSASASPAVLSPPNHKMVEVKVIAKVTDKGGSATWKIIGVGSNEPVKGPEYGDSSPDWLVTGSHTVKLRAERSGSGRGRIYSIMIQAMDESGNLSEPKVITVIVPKKPLKSPHFR